MDVLRKSLLFLSVPLVLLVVVGTIRARVDESRDLVLRDLKVFSEALYLVTNYYVEDVRLGQLERGAFQGLAESLDPWSSYWDPLRMEKLTERDESAGVGLLLVKSPQQYVIVASVIEGSPADRAGVRQGQFLETIDGMATKDLTLLEAQHMLRGPAGSSVELGFFRQSAEDESGERKDVVRESLDPLQVVVERPAEGVALLRVSSLQPGVASRAARALSELREEGVGKLVLDLRANVGGSPGEALALADLFLPAGPAFAERRRGGVEVRETASPKSWEGELVVLVGRGTVGEAELVARALRDADSPLVGQSTFGKRSRQETVRLRDGSGLHLSVAEYLAADGEALEPGGVSPTEEVAPSTPEPDEAGPTEDAVPPSRVEPEGQDEDAEREAAAEEEDGPETDPQLERALELLLGETAERKAA